MSNETSRQEMTVRGMFHQIDFSADDLGVLIKVRSTPGDEGRAHYVYSPDVPALRDFLNAIPNELLGF